MTLFLSLMGIAGGSISRQRPEQRPFTAYPMEQAVTSKAGA